MLNDSVNDRPIPDYVASVPYGAETLRQLTGADFRLMEQLVFLTRLRKKRYPGKAAYVQPGQQWLATKCGICRTYASERLNRLADLGLLRKVWRRAVDGIYQTCLYFVTPGARWLMARLLNAIGSKLVPADVPVEAVVPVDSGVGYTRHKRKPASTSSLRNGGFKRFFHSLE